MLTTAANLAIFGGGALGGAVFGVSDAGTFALAALAIVGVVTVVVVAARRNGFSARERNSGWANAANLSRALYVPAEILRRHRALLEAAHPGLST